MITERIQMLEEGLRRGFESRLKHFLRIDKLIRDGFYGV